MDSESFGIGKLTSTISLITAALAVVTKVFGLLPTIYYLPEILLGVAIVSLMVFAAKLIWSKKRVAGFSSQVKWRYEPRIRAFSVFALILSPCLGVTIWYFGLRLPLDQQKKVAELDHAAEIAERNGAPKQALIFYHQALAIDRRRADIKEKADSLEVQLKGVQK